MGIQTSFTSSSPPRRSRVALNALPVAHKQAVAEQPQHAEALPNAPFYFWPNQFLDLNMPPPVGIGLPTHTAQESSQANHVGVEASATVIEASQYQPAPQVSNYSPSDEEKEELKRRAQSLSLPCSVHPGLIVSRGHQELCPPLKKIYRDDIDLFFYVFARWAFIGNGIDDEAAQRMFDVLAKFQTQMDFVTRKPVSPPVAHAAQNGNDLGRMIARRAFQTNKEWMLSAISHFFSISQTKAEQALDAMDEEDYVVYTEWGPGSWMDAQLREKFFFEHTVKSLEKYCASGRKKPQSRAPIEAGDRGDDEDRQEDCNDGAGQMLTDEEITEASNYMDFLFMKSSGAFFKL
ncbi:hypothetical protein BKA64DRAFT_711258 [Cadophora sp. MPI-SDFR-AT-0126]|nr:hypothetical protein BKA64DRAFT_711258 [Leotiomycetes sp. MPI-SDFR-AT-0126]